MLTRHNKQDNVELDEMIDDETSDEPVSECFDKFMDDILIKENRRPESSADSPIRERARRHQERPLGRIRYGVIAR